VAALNLVWRINMEKIDLKGTGTKHARTKVKANRTERYIQVSYCGDSLMLGYDEDGDEKILRLDIEDFYLYEPKPIRQIELYDVVEIAGSLFVVLKINSDKSWSFDTHFCVGEYNNSSWFSVDSLTPRPDKVAMAPCILDHYTDHKKLISKELYKDRSDAIYHCGSNMFRWPSSVNDFYIIDRNKL